jgi:hypothetical protein
MNQTATGPLGELRNPVSIKLHSPVEMDFAQGTVMSSRL